MDEIEHVVFASRDHPLAKAAEIDLAPLLAK
jgi:hypothetical protein